MHALTCKLIERAHPSSDAGLQRRAALASTLVAGLELSRDGAAKLEQDTAFGEIVVRPHLAGGVPAAQDAAA